ncbi:MAG: cytochrome c3 family protein [Gemmatales bacterium]|nr:cytochrome c3 family protein [Gemmatales bacterium]MDW8388454.1 cytochrome c3 family protein [Gemmatales bacterium]
MAPLLALVVLAAVWFQCVRALGWRSGGLTGGILVAGLGMGSAWLLTPRTVEAPGSLARVPYVTSASCYKCHPHHYETWHRSFHRTMTQEATPQTVRGDFNDRVLLIRGIPTRMTREGDRFFMETADPAWARRMAETGKPPEEWGPAKLRRFEVVRLVGSHWFQECMYRDEAGRYWRLPVSFHIAGGRWVHTNGAFLAPDTNDFWEKTTIWNESCVYCHNTKPSKRPTGWTMLKGQRTPSGYDTRVAELGIACEACHGPGELHVQVNSDPGRRFLLQRSGQADPTIINPARLSPQRASEVCAHCHASTVPRASAWDDQHTDPYTPGDDLERFLFVFWSEAEQRQLYAEQFRRVPPPPPEPLDGRFWPDGTPLTTAVEYQGMALSRCYEEGKGRLSCLTCHTLHADDPNFQLGKEMATNEACLQCHAEYRDRIEAHTHHRTDSPGSLCYNCHMPYQAYSLLAVHRTHRIHSPFIKDSLGTGKPHACNLCHLDKTLAWTQEHLVRWYGHQPVKLDQDQETVAASVLHLLQADARSRAVCVGAFRWEPARQASGTAWMPPVLLDVLARDRFPAVRYLAERALRSLHCDLTDGYDYMESPEQRAAQVEVLRRKLAQFSKADPKAFPTIPLADAVTLDPSRLDDLLRRRTDPDVSIHE